MNELDEFVAGLINGFSLNVITDRSWFEIASILTPSVILILVLFGFSFFLQNRNWKIVTYTACFLLTLLFLPYELFRQSTALSKAEANVAEMQSSLKALLDTSDLDFAENLADKEAADKMLEEMIDDLGPKQKKELILVSWLVAENEKKSLRVQEEKQKLLTDEIKANLNETKREIIHTREPAKKIADDILKRVDGEISHLIENKMQAFNQGIDQSLGSFQQSIHAFVGNELNTYEGKLVSLTQKNIEELNNVLINHTSEARQEFTHQIMDVNKASLQKLAETQKNIDQLENTIEKINLEKVTAQIKQLSNSIDLIQKQNEVRFDYSECIRTAGMIDLIGKEEECRNKYYSNMNELTAQ